MLAGIFKDKINNSESYIYLDYDNGYKYHGVEISNGVIKNLSRNFFANIYIVCLRLIMIANILKIISNIRFIMMNLIIYITM